MENLVLEKVDKIYTKGKQKVQAVNQLSLAANNNEFIALLGPSGCGKSTTLRMIAGLEDISNGVISIAGTAINEKRPRDRNVGLAFENYALYPPLTVYENIAFNLRAKGTPQAQIDAEVSKISKLMKIESLLDLKPSRLSGGQKQRVNIARAIARRPKVLLLDEPLSHLDGKMRQAMRTEIKRLHHELGFTSLIVTHDQSEAMALADRIAIMNDGVLQQYGAPMEVYSKPNNLFVAGFIGEPAMNFLDGVVSFIDGDSYFIIPNKNVKFRIQNGIAAPNQEVVVGIRPNEIHIDFEQNDVLSKIVVIEDLVEERRITVDIASTSIVVQTEERVTLKTDDKLGVAFPLESLHIFEKQSGQRLN
ncbi:ABC transporter ATP-binding protein [Alicyclobacillus dauci]|uniref:ABC transporter ATP-binding protein n=1 Tax=Alicyclobacillus dauci TaxID=1475485 RepID=A0ABY6Z7H7_9BACL|nr:ABC transporter ATP-binding protein [Alicyclobacillus dauci]WAH38858.1 ABC transporter ATP-binding protein [Alicyclobacillus dauci]